MHTQTHAGPLPLMRLFSRSKACLHVHVYVYVFLCVLGIRLRITSVLRHTA